MAIFDPTLDSKNHDVQRFDGSFNVGKKQQNYQVVSPSIDDSLVTTTDIVLREDLAKKTYQLDETQRECSLALQEKEDAQIEIRYLTSVVGTLELSISKFTIECATLSEEKKRMQDAVFVITYFQ